MIGPVSVQADGWGWGMHPTSWMWGMWGAGMMVMMLVFWAVVIAAVVIGLRWLTRPGAGSPPDAALGILRERYARGEISKEEFDEKRRHLEG